MKLLISFVMTLATIYLAVPVRVPAQSDKDDKKKSETWSVGIRTNMMVLDSSQNYVDDIKASDIKLFEGDVEQKITYFAKKEHATNVVFVMDNTGSMAFQLNVETAIAHTVGQHLGKNDESMVIRFIGRDKITLEQKWSSNKKELMETLGLLYIEKGQSAIVDGVYLAVTKIMERAKTEKDQRFAIVLITDGDDRDSFYTPKQLFSLIKDTDIQIFVVGLTKEVSDKSPFNGPPPGPRSRAVKFLKTLAVRSGGAAYIFDKEYGVDDLNNTAMTLSNELRSQYVIGYESTNQKHDDAPRNLRVEIADGPKGEKRTGFLKTSFNVPEY